MRIVHCLQGRPDPDSFNGVNKSVHHLSRAQARLGLEVSVLGLDRATPLPAEGVHVRTFPRTPVPFHVPAALVRELERLRPQILHLHSPYFPEHAALARWARRRGVPYVVTPHGALSPGELRHRWPLKLLYKHLFERRILNGAAFVHAFGRHERLERYGVRSPVVVVPNGVEPIERPPSAAPSRVVGRFPELAGKRIFLYVGRLDPLQKGLDLMIEAAVRVGASDLAVVIAGPDWRRSRRRLQRIIERRGAGRTVVLAGPLSGGAKLDALAAAEVFIHTSRWEGLPLAVLEAAAFGLPSLLTTPADPLGRLGATHSALIVAADAESVAEGLRRMHAMSTQELAAMGARARAVVLSEFSWRRAAAELLEAYRRYTPRPGRL